MTPRNYLAPAALLVLALTASLATAGPWPSRWTAKPATPAPATQATPDPNALPPVSWPPKASTLVPQVTLPPLPAGPSIFRPPAPQLPQRTGLANAVQLGRPQPLLETPPNAPPIATLPEVAPQFPTNPTRPAPVAPEPGQPYVPPGVSRIVQNEIQQVGAEQRFDNPRVTTTVRGQVEDGAILPVRLDGPPPVAPPTGGEVPPLPPLPPDRYNAGVELAQPLNRSFGDQCAEFFGLGGPGCQKDGWFVSDHAFDEGIISPMTNIFLFEDPRSLTEVRPFWVYSKIPGNSDLQGGQAGILGTQARLAFTPNFSLVMNKLGGIGLHPDTPNFANVDGGEGLAELNIGPKWTFWRHESMVAATGLTFQLPIGGSSVFQDTGTMGLDLYASFGKNFWRTNWGSLNYMTTAGYNFRLDSTRSEFFHNHHHVSFDVANLHKIYPLFEVNWYKYTRTGANDLTFEGKDLFNFGAANAGLHSYVTVAGGARFKVTEQIQTGFAAEWSLFNNANSSDKFRLTFDLIFRY